MGKGDYNDEKYCTRIQDGDKDREVGSGNTISKYLTITAGGLLVIYSSTASQTRLLEQAVISQICNFTNGKNAISIHEIVHEQTIIEGNFVC